MEMKKDEFDSFVGGSKNVHGHQQTQVKTASSQVLVVLIKEHFLTLKACFLLLADSDVVIISWYEYTKDFNPNLAPTKQRNL